jgi:hypothetical protein
MIGGGYKALDELPRDLAWWRDNAAVQTTNLKQFIATGDASTLQNKPQFHIPYPLPDKLIAMVLDPAIRAILPANLRGELEVHSRRDLILHHGALLIPLGLALFMIASTLRRPPRPSTEQ